MTMSDSRVTKFSNDGLTFDVTDRGPIDGEIVICLHGFPQSSKSWTPVADLLVARGLRVLAPDQRGYSPDAQPRHRRDYAIDKLAGDVVALLDATGRSRAHIAGHDWGAGVAWQLAAAHSDRVATLTAVSTPHLGAMLKSFYRSSQGLRSWYMLALQVPWLPERAMGAGRSEQMIAGLVKLGLSEESARDSARLLSDPATARAMINWYRGLPFAGRRPLEKVSVPTTYIWSDQDKFLGRWAAEHTAKFVTGPYRFVEITGGSHWLPEQHPERLAEEIVSLTELHEAPRGIAD